MKSRSNRLSAAMMSGVSMLALGALAAGSAHAQNTLNGAPNQALTAGTITSDGTISDGGTGGGVQVNQSTTNTVDGAVIDSASGFGRSGLIFNGSPGAGADISVVLGNSPTTIRADGNGLEVYNLNGGVTLDMSTGGHSFVVVPGHGGTGVSVTGGVGDVLVTSVDNVMSGQVTGLYAGALSDAGSLTLDLSGGSISGLLFANGGAGADITIGGEDGMTTAVTSAGNGVYAVTSGDGTIDIATGQGGTVDANGVGVWATSSGAGDVSLSIGDVVTTATDIGVYVNAGGGDVTVDIAAAVNADWLGVDADTTGDGDVYVTSSARVTSTRSTAIAASSGTGSVNFGSADNRLAEVVAGTTGLFAATQGDVNIYATDVTGGTRGIVGASQGANANGSILIDVTGTITANNSFGVIGFNQGALTTNTITIRTADVTSRGGSGISAEANGDIDITSGAVTANAGLNGGGWDGIYAETFGDGNISITANGAVTGSFNGIDALAYDATTRGVITVTAAETVTGGTSGVRAVSFGVGGVTVDVADVVGQAGAGIYGFSEGDLSITAGAVTSIGGTAAGTTDNVAIVNNTSFQSGFGVIGYSPSGDVSITTTGLVTGGAAGGIFGFSGLGDVTVSAADVLAAAGRGVEAAASVGDINITVGDVSAQGNAVHAFQFNDGSIAVTVDGAVTSDTAYGVYADGNGPITVTTGADSSIDSTLAGIMVQGGAGAVNIAAGGDVTGGVEGVRVISEGDISVDIGGTITGDQRTVHLTTTAGDILVSGGGAVVSTNRSAVVGESGTGSVQLGQADGRLGEVTAAFTGVFGGTGGDVTIYASDVTAGGRAVMGQSEGDTADASVLIDVAGSIVSTGAWGIVGINNGTAATNTLTVHAADITSTNGAGVSAQTQGGDIDVSTTGTVIANAGPNGTWTGLYAETFGNGNISVTADGAVTGSYYGIDARALSATTRGAITVTATDTVTGLMGVHAGSTGAGGVSIDVADVVSTNGPGVYGYSAADLSIITGAVTAAGGLVPAATDNITATGGVAFNHGFGVIGVSTGGDVAIDTQGLVTGGAAGGVFAYAGAGDIAVSATSVAAAAGRGIEAVANGGDVSIAVSDSVTALGNAVFATNSGAGSIAVGGAGAVTSNSANGVYIRTTGAGALSIGSDAARFSSVDAALTGLFAAGSGDVSIIAGDVTGGTRGLVAASQGANPNGAVTIDLNGDVVGESAFGVIGVNNGVLATNTIDIVSIGTVTSTNGSAISAQSVAGDITIRADTVTANAGANGTWDGIFAQGQRDAVIDIAASGAVFGSFNGIEALTGGDGTRGGIVITAAGDVTGTARSAVRAVSTGGDISVVTGGALTGGQYGVEAVVSGAGSVAIEAAGLISTTGTGLFAQTVGGDIAITTLAGGAIAPGAQVGIAALTQTGSITINQAGDIGAIDEGMTVPTGILASIASGDADLTVVSTGGIYVTPGEGLESAGIVVTHGGTGAINVITSGIIDPGAYGVVIQGGGDVTYVADGGLVEGDVGVYLATTGDGEVNFTSTEGTEIIGLNGAGLTAEAGTGALNLTLDGVIAGASTGVVASGDGAVTLVSTADIVGGAGPGLDVSAGAAGLDLTIGGSITSLTGSAVNATSAGAASVTIAAGATVVGVVDSADSAVINLTTASGQTSTLTVAEGAVVAAADGSAFNVAVRAEGGSVVVANEGTIAGTVDFSALTGDNTGELVSGPDTVFLTGGTSIYSAGDDTFANAGTLATQGALTTFDFRGGDNQFANSGTIVVGVNPVLAGGSSFDLIGVTTFANSGLITMVNGVVGDSVVMSGADYVASGDAVLAIDAQVGVVGGAADTLTVGQASGVTSVLIAARPGFSGLDEAGVRMVTGDADASNFVLDAGSSYYSADFGGVIDGPGLFHGRLASDAQGVVLVTAPKTEAFQFGTLAAQAQSAWRASAVSDERQAQRRDRIAAGAAQGLNLWADVRGTAVSRDIEASFGVDNHDVGYDQDVETLSAGIEIVQGPWSYGVSIGHVDAETQFDTRQSEVELRGGIVSAHLGWMNPSGLFAAASVAQSRLDAEIDTPQLTGLPRTEADVETVGGMVEAGIRRGFAWGSVIEPSVSLAYAETSIEDISGAGSTFVYDDAESLRLAAGVRMSGQTGLMGEGWNTRYTLGARLVNEFSGDNDTVLLNSGAPVVLTDTLDGLFGEIRAGLSSQGASGWIVFGEAMGRFNENSTEVGLTAGVRIRY